MKATDILTAAAATLDQRGKDYDQPEGERSMGRIVDTFNALTGHALTEAQGWQFMVVLKLVRMGTASDPADSAIDCAAYAALAGEALGKVEALTHLAEQEATAQKPERWKPSMEEKYFCVSNDAEETYNLIWRNDDCDRVHLAFGNVFRTREEAEAKRAEIVGEE